MELMKSLNFAKVYDMLGGITDWEANGLPLVVPTTPPTTTPTTTTTPTNNLPADLLVLDIILPFDIVTDEVFTIALVVTNTGNSQLSCDIPITITSSMDPTNTVTYVISVTLDAGETKEVYFDEAVLPLFGSYDVKAGDISKPLDVH